MMEMKNKLFQIGIVVPCYNEAHRLALAEFEKNINENQNHFFCFVNDGSTDTTLKILEAFSGKYPDQIAVVNIEINSGKAESVRSGMNYLLSQNKFDILGFLDADLATPLDEIDRITKLFNNDKKLIVFGSRIKHIGGHVERRFFRYLLGRVFATIVSNWLLKTAVYDTQCGFKFFRPIIAEPLFEETFRSKWFFDIELFCRTKIKFPNTDINEIAQEFFLSTWKDQKGSKIKLSDYIKVPLELIKLKYHYKISK
jgi:dolichyl-phosphate beta-glucosyltransferase